MPRKSLHGRTCGVSCDGGRARTCRDGRCVWFSIRQPTDFLVRCSRRALDAVGLLQGPCPPTIAGHAASTSM
ncbi:hypothetical protein DYQ94_16865 [Xanthomonas sp. LMG 8993]|nr:hypothetical protein [Xanthomonas sp. LMG 8993]